MEPDKVLENNILELRAHDGAGPSVTITDCCQIQYTLYSQ